MPARNMAGLMIWPGVELSPLEFARQRIAESPEMMRAAVVLDGYTHIDDVQEDAILVYAQERTEATSHRLAQRYRWRGLRKRLERVGNIAYFGEDEPLFIEA
jgi:hypothetical protein